MCSSRAENIRDFYYSLVKLFSMRISISPKEKTVNNKTEHAPKCVISTSLFVNCFYSCYRKELLLLK